MPTSIYRVLSTMHWLFFKWKLCFCFSNSHTPDLLSPRTSLFFLGIYSCEFMYFLLTKYAHDLDIFHNFPEHLSAPCTWEFGSDAIIFVVNIACSCSALELNSTYTIQCVTKSVALMGRSAGYFVRRILDLSVQTTRTSSDRMYESYDDFRRWLRINLDFILKLVLQCEIGISLTISEKNLIRCVMFV